MLQLVSSQEWSTLNQTEGHTIYHRDYGNNIHGLVFVDDKDGQVLIMDDNDNILDACVSSILDFSYLKEACDLLFKNALQVG